MGGELNIRGARTEIRNKRGRGNIENWTGRKKLRNEVEREGGLGQSSFYDPGGGRPRPTKGGSEVPRRVGGGGIPGMQKMVV